VTSGPAGQSRDSAPGRRSSAAAGGSVSLAALLGIISEFRQLADEHNRLYLHALEGHGHGRVEAANHQGRALAYSRMATSLERLPIEREPDVVPGMPEEQKQGEDPREWPDVEARCSRHRHVRLQQDPQSARVYCGACDLVWAVQVYFKEPV
jgi:hypothetical protein